MDCRGALNVAISNFDPNQVDIICPVYGDTCYSPERCHGFNDTPFFSICETSESSGSDCKFNLCFGNISKVLNNSRLDFFVSEKVICDITAYTARRYIRSFEIKGELNCTISISSGLKSVLINLSWSTHNNITGIMLRLHI